ncbi:MAG: class I SAM-dependent methyltransferase [Thermoplasmata archaeon]
MTHRRFRTHTAADGFDRSAEQYERARPGYPVAAVRTLAKALGIGPGRTVVELASGTGKFTRALLPFGATIVGVEPLEGMRAVFERVVPTVAVLPGTAESIPLPAGFADAVVVAAAFHWFRPRPAVREIARVLRPAGGIGLVWNTRDDASPFSAGMSVIVDRYRGSAPRARPGGSETAFGRPGSPFRPLHYRRFRQVQRLTLSGAVDRVLCVSYIASLPANEQRRIAVEVRALFRRVRSAERGSIALPYWTDIYWARRR